MKKSLADFKTLKSALDYICRKKKQGVLSRQIWTVQSVVSLVHGWYTAMSKEEVEQCIRNFSDVSFPPSLYGLLVIGTPTPKQLVHSHVTYNGSRISIGCYVTLQKLQKGAMTPEELGVSPATFDSWVSTGLMDWDGSKLSVASKVANERSILDICMDNLVRRKIDVQME